MKRTSGAVSASSRREFARPTLRGLAPTSTNDAAVMISAESSSVIHHWATIWSNASVTSTAAVVSAVILLKLTALTCAPGSAAMASSEFRARDVSASSVRSARDCTESAASTAAIRPPKATRRNATMKNSVASIRNAYRWRS